MGFNILIHFSLEAPFIFCDVAQVRTSLFMCRSSQTPLSVCEEQFGESEWLVSLVKLTVGGETQTGSISINFSVALAQKRLGCEIGSVLSRQNVLCWFLFVVYP